MHNEFVSNVVFNIERESGFHEMEYCKDVMSRSAVVDIMLTKPDAMVFSQSVVERSVFLTRIGGLFSLYTGFSFLSLGELLFWALRFLLAVVTF